MKTMRFFRTRDGLLQAERKSFSSQDLEGAIQQLGKHINPEVLRKLEADVARLRQQESEIKGKPMQNHRIVAVG